MWFFAIFLTGVIFLKIFICDDNEDFSKKLKSDIIKKLPDTQISVFNTIASLMFALEDEGAAVDAIFLDIENADGNGIDAAAKIKKLLPLIKLVFVTGYGDKYSQDIFNCPAGCEPTAYLIKPIDEKYLSLALGKIQASTSQNEKYLSITSNRETAFINEKEIIYISSDKRKVTIFTKSKSFTYYDKLENLLSKLGKGFCRCHKSYIVNLAFINAVDSQTTLTLSDGAEIPIGKSFLKSFKEQLVLYKAAYKKEY